MQLQQPFNARTVDPNSYPPPPALADYHVRIVDSEAKPTSDNTGGYIDMILEILDPGAYQGRKQSDKLNLFSTKSEIAVKMANARLSAYCHVTGVFDVQDTRQLHNIPFIATIGPQTGDPRYGQVFAVKDLNGNIPGQPTAAPGAPAGGTQSFAPAPPASAPPAWGAQPPAATPPANPWGPPAATAPPAQPAAQPWQQPAAAPAQPWQQPGPPAATAPPSWQPGATAPPAKAPWEK